MNQSRRSFFGAVAASLLAPRLIPPDPASIWIDEDIPFHARNFRAGQLSNEIIIHGGCRWKSTKAFRMIAVMKENQ